MAWSKEGIPGANSGRSSSGEHDAGEHVVEGLDHLSPRENVLHWLKQTHPDALSFSVDQSEEERAEAIKNANILSAILTSLLMGVKNHGGQWPNAFEESIKNESFTWKGTTYNLGGMTPLQLRRLLNDTKRMEGSTSSGRDDPAKELENDWVLSFKRTVQIVGGFPPEELEAFTGSLASLRDVYGVSGVDLSNLWMSTRRSSQGRGGQFSPLAWATSVMKGLALADTEAVTFLHGATISAGTDRLDLTKSWLSKERDGSEYEGERNGVYFAWSGSSPRKRVLIITPDVRDPMRIARAIEQESLLK